MESNGGDAVQPGVGGRRWIASSISAAGSRASSTAVGTMDELAATDEDRRPGVDRHGRRGYAGCRQGPQP